MLSRHTAIFKAAVYCPSPVGRRRDGGGRAVVAPAGRPVQPVASASQLLARSLARWAYCYNGYLQIASSAQCYCCCVCC